MLKDHTYEEIRKAAIDILMGKEQQLRHKPTQFRSFMVGTAEVIQRRDPSSRPEPSYCGDPRLSNNDELLFQEMFWELFRQGIITLGLDTQNEEFPWFRVSSFGKKILENQNPYFFHDVSSYEAVIKQNIPDIDEVTLLYLKEAM